MPDDPLIYPGDDKRDAPIRRRSHEETAREQSVNRAHAPQETEAAPGGAEGGEDSPSRDTNVLPADDNAPLGDTDQHTDSSSLPPHRAERNQS